MTTIKNMQADILTLDIRTESEYYSSVFKASQKSRREGLLSLEEDIDALPTLIKSQLQLVIDGREGELVQKIGEDLIKTLLSTMEKQLRFCEFLLLKGLFRVELSQLQLLTQTFCNSKKEIESEPWQQLLGCFHSVSQKKADYQVLEDFNIPCFLLLEYGLQPSFDSMEDSLKHSLLKRKRMSIQSSYSKLCLTILEGIKGLQMGSHESVLQMIFESGGAHFEIGEYIPKASPAFKKPRLEPETESMLSQGEIDSLLMGDFGLDEAEEMDLDIPDKQVEEKFSQDFAFVVGSLDGKAMQKLVADLPSSLIARALIYEPEDIQNKFFDYLSRNFQVLIRSEMEYQGDIGIARSRKAKVKILHQVLELEACGEIEVG